MSSPDKRVVVTGSAGRVGRQVVQHLIGDGVAVTGFDRRASGLAPSPLLHETLGELEDPSAVGEAMKDARAVLHLGAFMSWQAADAERLHRTNVDGTRHVLQAAAAAGVDRFVFASSGEVYPENAPAFLPITEDHPLEPRSPYGLTKLLGEELVRFFARTAGLATVVLRFSHTQDAAELLDPASFFSGPRFFLEPKIRQQEALGNAAAVEALRRVDDGRDALVLSRNEQGRPFQMHITETRDMVAGVLLALSHPDAPGQAFNLGSTEPFAFAEVLPRMAEALGLPLRVVDLPGAGVHYHTSNRKIRERLGFQPAWTTDRMLDEAIRLRSMKRAS